MGAQNLVKKYSRIAISVWIGLMINMVGFSAEHRYLNVKQVILSGDFGNLEIDVQDGFDVIVESVPDKSQFYFRQAGDILSIDSSHFDSKKSEIISGNITNIAVGENASSAISIGGTELYSSSKPRENMHLLVPKKVNIQLRGRIKTARIGNTFGKLILDLRGTGDLQVGSVSDISADLMGATSVHIGKATGDVTIDIKGSSEFYVDSGDIRWLNVATSGVSNVNVNAIAEKGNISVTGAGVVKVKYIKIKPKISIIGSGSIDVGDVIN